jgi:hypothetical protein
MRFRKQLLYINRNRYSKDLTNFSLASLPAERSTAMFVDTLNSRFAEYSPVPFHFFIRTEEGRSRCIYSRTSLQDAAQHHRGASPFFGEVTTKEHQ